MIKNDFIFFESYNRPKVIEYDITYKCNFRCRHCFNLSGNGFKDELNDKEVLNLFEQIIDIFPKVFCFCGGEPLLRKDILLKGVEKLTKAGIIVNMVTNGYFMNDEIAKKLKNSGIQNIQISIDGNKNSHNWLRKGKDYFNKAINALDILKKNNITSSVAYLPFKKSYNHIEKMIKLFFLKNVSFIRIQPLMYIGRSLKEMNKYALSEKEYRQFVKKINKSRIKYEDYDQRIEWGDPVDHIIRFSTQFTNSIINLQIGANGDLYISPYLPIVFGNIRKNSIEKYFEYGLNRVWGVDIVKKMSKNIYSINTLGKKTDDNIPLVFYDKPVDYDLEKNQIK